MHRLEGTANDPVMDQDGVEGLPPRLVVLGRHLRFLPVRRPVGSFLSLSSSIGWCIFRVCVCVSFFSSRTITAVLDGSVARRLHGTGVKYNASVAE